MMCLAVSIIRPTAEYRRAGAVLGKNIGGGLAPLNFPSSFSLPPLALNFPPSLSSLPFPPPSPFLFSHPFLPLPSPFPSPPSHPLRSRPPQIQLRGLRERCKLPQPGLGQSPSRNRIWSILALNSDIWWQQFLVIFLRIN